MHLYRIAQEAVANAVRHGKCTSIMIKIELSGDDLTLIVEDNGRGMRKTQNTQNDGMGLRTMRYRAQAIGANLVIEPRIGGGTRVRCQLKVEPTPITTIL